MQSVRTQPGRATAQPARMLPNRNRINLFIDITLLVAFLVTMAPHFSGTPIHEWLSIALGAAIITHLLMHWQWLVEVTKRFFGKVGWQSRLNYILNTLLFITMTVVIFSGLMISEAALPALGITVQPGGIWHSLHELSANGVLVLVGLHIGLHWQWIVSTIKRFLITPLTGSRKTPTPLVEHSPIKTGE